MSKLWAITLVVFAVLYLLCESILFWLFDGSFKLFRVNDLGLGTGSSVSYIKDIQYFFVSSPYENADLGAMLGASVLIGTILLLTISYYLTKKIILKNSSNIIH